MNGPVNGMVVSFLEDLFDCLGGRASQEDKLNVRRCKVKILIDKSPGSLVVNLENAY